MDWPPAGLRLRAEEFGEVKGLVQALAGSGGHGRAGQRVIQLECAAQGVHHHAAIGALGQVALDLGAHLGRGLVVEVSRQFIQELPASGVIHSVSVGGVRQLDEILRQVLAQPQPGAVQAGLDIVGREAQGLRRLFGR